MLRLISFLFLLLFALPVHAEQSDEARYKTCMNLARENPEQGFEDGIAWESLGGGEAAEHCTATALISLKKYTEAAGRLEKLVEKSQQSAKLRGALLTQTAKAWSLGGNLERAAAAYKAASKLTPYDPLLYLERAIVLAEAKNYKGAIDDLNQALKLDPLWSDAMVLRASAYRYLDSTAAAKKDLKRALELAPGHQEGLLERGILARLEKRTDDARRDWLNVIKLNPNTPAAESARKNLQIMDGQGGKTTSEPPAPKPQPSIKTKSDDPFWKIW